MSRHVFNHHEKRDQNLWNSCFFSAKFYDHVFFNSLFSIFSIFWKSSFSYPVWFTKCENIKMFLYFSNFSNLSSLWDSQYCKISTPKKVFIYVISISKINFMKKDFVSSNISLSWFFDWRNFRPVTFRYKPDTTWSLYYYIILEHK